MAASAPAAAAVSLPPYAPLHPWAPGIALAPSLKLRNGVELPAVGLGTFRLMGEEAVVAVQAALGAGLRHIDTASIYKNEAAIREALAASGLPREEVFITSKVSPYEQGRGKAREAVEGILERLGTDYLDLCLIHWPGVARKPATSPIHAEKRAETWADLEALYKEGRLRAIGVSNYEEGHLRGLLAGAEVAPMVNQFEVHPRRQRRELRAFCQEHGITVVAYSSLGSAQGCGGLLGDPAVGAVAAAVGRTPAQALLRWGLQEGLAVIPKSSRPDRIAQAAPEALLGGDWGLTEEQMYALAALEDGHKFAWDPAGIV
ncbi:hypothetical protein HYH03_004441 [Edaphochlamys debaryana]|uniref:NADP-dependent oxidoreductase domain-containing protein n=1 Tax=Edaphochlamys debaryana TaxID=47281 RepID=A0A835YHF8_9CHLO|nr:hypothetical protein HYH03_004441 [Edaphochlamys debaryana]|eukprot:KAG2497704.1 hypothetical protein HYH03_004441 [Edaphochlamys debaryana]